MTTRSTRRQDFIRETKAVLADWERRGLKKPVGFGDLARPAWTRNQVTAAKTIALRNIEAR